MSALLDVLVFFNNSSKLVCTDTAEYVVLQQINKKKLSSVISYFKYLLKLVHKLKFNNYYFVIFFISITACTSHHNKQRSTSFYIWQNQFDWTNNKANYLKETQTKNLYIKYIEINNQEIITTKTCPIPNLNIIPVIRIDNTFLSSNELSNAEKCEKIYSLVNSIYLQNSNKNISTLQIDCDYTTANKNNYQQLIKSLQTNYHLTIQITLNLYRTTSIDEIPIADKYFIMLYDYHIKDELKLFDENAMNYFKKSLEKFNRPFAYALPIFSRCIIHSHKGYTINYSLQIEEIKNNSNFSFTGEDTYIALKNCITKDVHFAINDKITFQESTLENIASYNKYIHEIDNINADEVAYFSLNESTISHFPSNIIIDLK